MAYSGYDKNEFRFKLNGPRLKNDESFDHFYDHLTLASLDKLMYVSTSLLSRFYSLYDTFLHASGSVIDYCIFRYKIPISYCLMFITLTTNLIYKNTFGGLTHTILQLETRRSESVRKPISKRSSFEK